MPGDSFDVTFESVPDAGLDPDMLAIRRRKEQEGLEDLLGLVAQLQSLAALHEWLFSQHRAYALEPEQAETPARESY
jgi:hypothetical protein